MVGQPAEEGYRPSTVNINNNMSSVGRLQLLLRIVAYIESASEPNEEPPARRLILELDVPLLGSLAGLGCGVV